MKTARLIERLTDEAVRLAIVRPQVVERDGVVSLRAGRIGLDGDRHVAFLGLVRAGLRRLTAELRSVADSI